MAEDTGTAATEFDMDAAVDTIGAGLGLSEDDDTGGGDDTAPASSGDDTVDAAAATDVAQPAAEPVARKAPSSWAQDKHAIFDTLPPAAQEQILLRESQMQSGVEKSRLGLQIQDVVKPFEGMLRENNVDAPKAIQYLLSAHQRLSYGSMEARRSAYEQLGRDLGLSAADPNAPQVDPTVKALQDQVQQIQSGITQRQQAELNAAKERTAMEVNEFASNPEHAYFDEVAEDILPFLNAGLPLKEAYEKAVWANPVTRAKEQYRISTETEKKLRENARLDALKGRKAASTNVRTRDTNKAPTEPLGTMEDTMKETLNEIRSRTH